MIIVLIELLPQSSMPYIDFDLDQEGAYVVTDSNLLNTISILYGENDPVAFHIHSGSTTGSLVDHAYCTWTNAGVRYYGNFEELLVPVTGSDSTDMRTPVQESFYVLPMYNHGSASMMSLNGVATAVYGRTYDGQQASMLDNDSSHVVDLRTDGEIEHWVYLNGPRHEVKQWLSSSYRGDIDDVRAAPGFESMLATLVLDGHLPRGRYLVQVSW